MKVTIETYFKRYSMQDAALFNLIQEIQKFGSLITYGGFVRGFLENKNVRFLRDIDLMIMTEKGNDFWSFFFKNHDFKINSMGGFKITIGQFTIDFWELNDTWAFKNNIYKPSVENLEKTVFLNIDGAVYDFENKKMYNKLYTDALNRGCLDVVLKENPLIELNFSRAVYFAKKYSLTFSDELSLTFKEYFQKFSTNFLIQKIIDVQNKHYGASVNSIEEIKEALRYIYIKC